MLVLLLACEAALDPIPQCIEDHAPEAGYGFDSDPGYGVPAEDAEASCLAAGGSCDADLFITRDAAMCIGGLENLPEGVDDWMAGLSWHEGYAAVVWSVLSPTTQEEGYTAGEAVVIDAMSGEVLGRISWESTP